MLKHWFLMDVVLLLVFGNLNIWSVRFYGIWNSRNIGYAIVSANTTIHAYFLQLVPCSDEECAWPRARPHRTLVP